MQSASSLTTRMIDWRWEKVENIETKHQRCSKNVIDSWMDFIPLKANIVNVDDTWFLQRTFNYVTKQRDML